MSMAADELAHRIQTVLGDRPDIRQQKMFGGVAFMMDGNMLCGPMKDGTLMVRAGPDRMEDALSRPGAVQMKMRDRVMSGFVEVGADAIEDDVALAEWIALAERFVKTLPPK